MRNTLMIIGLAVGCLERDPSDTGQAESNPTQIEITTGQPGTPVPPEFDSGEPEQQRPVGCTVTESEPNDDTSTFDEMSVGDLMCGVFDYAGDADALSVDIDEAGWYRVQIIAGNLFSSARPRVFLVTSDGTYIDVLEPTADDDVDRTLFVEEDALNLILLDENWTYGEHAYWRVQIDSVDSPTVH
jgi:hypothetical protein